MFCIWRNWRELEVLGGRCVLSGLRNAFNELLLIYLAISVCIEGDHSHFKVGWGQFMVRNQLFYGKTKLVSCYNFISIQVCLLKGLEGAKLLTQERVIKLADQ